RGARGREPQRGAGARPDHERAERAQRLRVPGYRRDRRLRRGAPPRSCLRRALPRRRRCLGLRWRARGDLVAIAISEAVRAQAEDAFWTGPEPPRELGIERVTTPRYA